MHRYEIIIYWSDDDAAFVAEVPELPGCAAHGSTSECALANCQDAIDLWLDTAKEFGCPLPAPKRAPLTVCVKRRRTTACSGLTPLKPITFCDSDEFDMRCIVRRKIFISYSHDDDRWRERLVEQLRVLEMADLLTVWDDTQIRAGEDWYERINQAMLECRVAFLLVSPAFLGSKFILGNEVPELIRCHQEDGMSLIPLLVRACPWRAIDWLAKLEIRPRGAKPLAGRRKAQVEELLADVAYEALDMLEERLGKSQNQAVATGGYRRSS